MEETLVKITSSVLPNIYPANHKEKIFADQRVVEVSSLKEVFFTEDSVRTVDGTFARKERIRSKVYPQFELTIFAKESERIDVFFEALDIKVYFDDNTTHHAVVTEVREPEKVENTEHLAYRIKYIDMNPDNFWEEPISDFLRSDKLLERYNAEQLHRIKVSSWQDFDDDEFGKQQNDYPLTASNTDLNTTWNIILPVTGTLTTLSTGDTVRILLSGGVTLPLFDGTVISVTDTEVTIFTPITEELMSELEMLTTTASVRWKVDKYFYTKIIPEIGFGDLTDKSIEVDGLKIPSKLQGSDLVRLTFYLNDQDAFRIKKYLGLVAGNVGSIKYISTDDLELESLEHMQVDIAKIDENLWKVIVPMKVKNEILNIYNL